MRPLPRENQWFCCFSYIVIPFALILWPRLDFICSSVIWSTQLFPNSRFVFSSLQGKRYSIQNHSRNVLRSAVIQTSGTTKKSQKQDTYDSLDNFSEHDMFSVQPWSFGSGDEELWTIGVWSSVGHRQPSDTPVLLLEVLIFEFVSVDTFTWSNASVKCNSSVLVRAG